jgi:hypothetical protein
MWDYIIDRNPGLTRVVHLTLLNMAQAYAVVISLKLRKSTETKEAWIVRLAKRTVEIHASPLSIWLLGDCHSKRRLLND